MIIKDSNKEVFFEFNPVDFSLIQSKEKKFYQGKLFKIGRRRYVITKKGDTVMLYSKAIQLDINDYEVEYKEKGVFSYLEIRSNKSHFKIKNLKSIWEFLNISTYDYLDKKDDNKLFYMFEYIKDLGSPAPASL